MRSRQLSAASVLLSPSLPPCSLHLGRRACRTNDGNDRQLHLRAGRADGEGRHTVTWKNHDDIPHTVVSAGKFRSKALDTDDSFSFTFTSAGDYKYFCSLHPHMTGMIKVE